MKSYNTYNIYKYIIIFNVILISISCVKIQTKNKEQKTESIMDLFNEMIFPLITPNTVGDSLGKGNSNNKIIKEIKNTDLEEVKNEPIEEVKNEPQEEMKNQNKSLEPISEKLILNEGYLQIYSAKLQNQYDFPPINLPDGNQITIKTDINGYLINPSLSLVKDKLKAGSDLYFYFRLNKNNLYFSINQRELNILNSVRLQSITSVEGYDDYSDDGMCFQITDNQDKNWKLCALTIESKNRWICILSKLINKTSNRCPFKQPEKTNIVEVKINKPIILVPLPSRECNAGWNYQLKGSNWECDCKEGKEQAPIDLPPKEEAINSFIQPKFKYQLVNAKSKDSTLDKMLKKGENLKIIYKENIIRIMHNNFGQAITYDGTIYQAEEIQFHTPSEHTLDGNRYDMEMQIHHYGITKGDIGKQLVLSILFEAKAGFYNQFLADLDLFDLPNKHTPERIIKNDLFIPKVFYTQEDKDEVKYLKPFSFYTYQGSLTSPPCAEDTIMIVSADIQKMSKSSLNFFREAIEGKLYINKGGNFLQEDSTGDNNREIQNRNGRPVYYFDCGKYCVKEEKKKKIKAHYEKIPRNIMQYFYVTGDQPSGLPGAFVIDESEASMKGKIKLPTN